MTPDKEQIKAAARVATDHPKVVGIKMYAGESVGNLPMPDLGHQEMAYKTLTEEKYRGVLATHCEHKALSNDYLWDPLKPSSWNLARPPNAEAQSIANQIAFAISSGFEGHLHICHTSTAVGAYLPNIFKGIIPVTTEVAPHHLTYSTKDMTGPEGVRLKVNPPIRDENNVRELMSMLREEIIDIIATDHAPHTKVQKTYHIDTPKKSYMSGIPSLDNYKEFLQGLVDGHGFSPEQIERLTYTNVKRIYPKVME